jgi:hypothetical protein
MFIDLLQKLPVGVAGHYRTAAGARRHAYESSRTTQSPASNTAAPIRSLFVSALAPYRIGMTMWMPGGGATYPYATGGGAA